MYLPIVRRYRPSKFSDVVGQTVTKKILVNSILMGKPISAMLVSGIRGTGKTTLARLYAKALNCASFHTLKEPCGNCSSCVDVDNGTHPDIIEFDAASNNGVDFVRDLCNNLNHVETYNRKVIIFDEVHMFTNAAQASLLKVLEEPPESTSFILVTTEPEKLDVTIRSRCLSMPLKPLQPIEVESSLRRVLEAEQRPFTDGFAASLSLLGGGSIRDVHQVLENLILAACDNVLDESILEDHLGVVSIMQYKKLAATLCATDISQAFLAVKSWYSDGIDLQHLFLHCLPILLRDFAVYLSGVTSVGFQSGIPYEIFRDKLTLTQDKVRKISKCWEDFYDLMKGSVFPHIVWEMFFIHIIGSELEGSDALTDYRSY